MRFILRVSAFFVTPLLTLALLPLPLAAQEHKQDRPQARPTPSATSNGQGKTAGTHASSSAKPNAQSNKGIIDVDFNAPKPQAAGAGNQVTGNTVSNAGIGTNSPKPRTPGVGAGTGNQVTGNTVSNASVDDSGRQTRSNTRGSNKTNAQVKGNTAGMQTKGNAKAIMGNTGKQATGTAAQTQPKSTTSAPK